MKLLKFVLLFLAIAFVGNQAGESLDLFFDCISEDQPLGVTVRFGVWAITTLGVTGWLIYLACRNESASKKVDERRRRQLCDLLERNHHESRVSIEYMEEVTSRLDKFNELFYIDEHGVLSIKNAVIRDQVELTKPGRNGEGQKPHPDDAAVDMFAAAMKAKLAAKREAGLGGWETADPSDLLQDLNDQVARDHLDPIDIAAYAMFLWHNKTQ